MNVRPYRLSEKHKEEVNRQITKMLDNNIVRPTNNARVNRRHLY